MIGKDIKAGANPTKGFFVRMITRDITLEDCILDLIDNSVDGAWRSEGSRPMGLADDADLSVYVIHIEATAQQFSIRDNCGGMTLDDAVDHAFSFGRKALDTHDDYSIGVYGIGMKRAVFKLGTDIRIRSTYTEKDGSRQSFAVPIVVADWLSDDTPPWDFDIVSDEPLDTTGVEIVVKSLTAGARSSFDSPAFIQNLRRTIGRDYSLHLNRGLKIFLNNVEVPGWNIELRQSEEFKPMRVIYEDEVEGDTVWVEVIGGMAAPPPESSDPDEEDEGDRRFGWYVVCNGRIVLAADKTSVAGWGSEEWPQWHRQYSGFIGVILFTAANAAALPLTTTKRSVDISSEIYRRARPERAANINYSVPVSKLKKLAKELGSISMPYREVGLKSFDYTYSDLGWRRLMPSFDVVNYSLRPSKAIQRQIVFDGVRELQSHLDLENLVYIGFGSIWFTDFSIAHKVLRVDDMVSIEGDDVGFRRAVFNLPYATVRVKHGLSNEVLSTLYEDEIVKARPWFVWLDYDYEFNETVKDDVRSLVENAPANSIVIITFNGQEMKYGTAQDRPARLRELFGAVVPDDLPKRACREARLHETLADFTLDFMRAMAADPSRPGGFVPAFRAVYKDSSPMITASGLLPAKGAARVATDIVKARTWPCCPSKPIVAPHLTIREATLLQSQLPLAEQLTRDLVRRLGFDLEDEQIETFQTYYKHYPSFAQIIS